MTESTELALPVPAAQVEAAKRRCVQAIEGAWKAYTDPESGLKLREQQVATAGARVSSYIYNLARYAAEVCPRKYRPHEVFGAFCAYAEGRMKEKHSVDNLSEAFPSWKTFKSNIMGGLRDGLDPHEFPNQYEFHKASVGARLSVISTREAAADQRLLTSSPSHEVTAPSEPSDSVTQHPMRIEPARRFFRSTTMPSPLKLLLAQLTVEAGYLKKGKEDEAEAIIREARDRLAALVDKRRVKDEATKLAME